MPLTSLAVVSLYTVVGGQVAQPDSAITRKAAPACGLINSAAFFYRAVLRQLADYLWIANPPY